MAYPPSHHQESEFINIVETIKTFPLALIITAKDDKPLLTHLPLLYKPDADTGSLLGHIDNTNPQLSHLQEGSKVTLVFNGPDSYISPSIYTTPQLPTWNYIKIHLEGTLIKLQSSEELKETMVELTQYLEGENQKFQLDINDSRMEAFVKYVTGFEIKITSWEGKFKLSQDKNENDIQIAKGALTENYSSILNNYVEAIYKNHKPKNK
ncbi:FMN-binding negative transcriptional regulator [Leeuwenhoekiella aequorea]|uniref:FMN-binding negative transcriptional regulator n=1 Tax=Leeuwenhoekiella aequorea TaxID=283736 RepID=UPI00352F98E3